VQYAPAFSIGTQNKPRTDRSDPGHFSGGPLLITNRDYGNWARRKRRLVAQMDARTFATAFATLRDSALFLSHKTHKGSFRTTWNTSDGQHSNRKPRKPIRSLLNSTRHLPRSTVNSLWLVHFALRVERHHDFTAWNSLIIRTSASKPVRRLCRPATRNNGLRTLARG
jgi:hypothetical protein